MPRLPARVWRAAGGCAFAHEPNTPVWRQPAFWLPEYFPGTLILETTPEGFEATVPLDLTELGTLRAERADTGGRELVFEHGSDEIHLRLEVENAEARPSFAIPNGPTAELRLETTLWLLRRLRGKARNLLPAALRLTAFERQRLVQLLHAFDVHDAGGGPRDVASEVLASDQAAFPSVEWKDSYARRKANRLIQESADLVQRGYLALLLGR